MMKQPLQVLLKWSETLNGKEYWYVIRRGSDGRGFFIEGYTNANTGKAQKPEMALPVSQAHVAEMFQEQGKTWIWEPIDDRKNTA